MRTRKARCEARGRHAFTMTELMMATALTALVLSQTGMALLSCLRMFEATVADMELSLQSRALREKLLYHIYTDGGLMSACQSGLVLVNATGSSGKGVTFKPVNGQQNTVTLDSTKKLVANRNMDTKWLNCGTALFQGTNVFSFSSSTGTVDTVDVTLDMAITIATRKYVQRSLVKVQVMNNK